MNGGYKQPLFNILHMKNIRKFETTAEMDSTVLEDVSVSYNVETDVVLSMPLNPKTIDYSTMYTTFEALEDGTFSFNKKGTGDNIQYSKDNGTTWTPLASGETVSVVTGDKVMWKSTITPSGSGFNAGIGRFKSSNNFKAHGNVMSLLYGDNFTEQTSLVSKFYAFFYLFAGCTKMIDASNLILPATNLSNKCYYYMFGGCKSLTAAPELPATTLGTYCYHQMFWGCSGLTTAPELPATTLRDYCYQSMFSGCTSLTTAPELPATTLADYCYETMFSGCKSLTTAPELPATTLESHCYSGMFAACTSLTTAPELYATTLANDCYYQMFYGSKSLTAAPELPATTLCDYCYREMFSGCTSLTTAPELPATTLRDYCYQSMFSGCASLKQITMLATDISASSCLNNWVDGVSSTGTFVKHPDMTSLPTGSSGIPSNWTVEDAVL